ncbi:MAG: LEA type 2 family protein [Candidatus Aminicenantes bacterium]|nr:LEA type 2 family protein [Candidatus Aminicenantes bacterium]
MSAKRKSAAARFAAAVIVALLAFEGPAFGLSKKDLAVSLKEKRIRDLSSRGLTLAFYVGIRNSSAAACFLARYNYRVTVNQKEYLRLPVVLNEPIRVGAGEEVLIAIPLKVTYALLFEAIGPVEEKAVCDMVGDLVFADEKKKEEKIGFAFSGGFPIFKDPVVEFLPLRVNDLTVGGGDVVFDVKFGNPNNYDLIVDTITYDLRFGETMVLKGEVPGDKSVPARGDKTLSLPFLMDFFEVGKEVHDLLQKPPAPCRFSGEIAIHSVWGRLVIAFDKAGPVDVAKKPEGNPGP